MRSRHRCLCRHFQVPGLAGEGAAAKVQLHGKAAVCDGSVVEDEAKVIASLCRGVTVSQATLVGKGGAQRRLNGRASVSNRILCACAACQRQHERADEEQLDPPLAFHLALLSIGRSRLGVADVAGSMVLVCTGSASCGWPDVRQRCVETMELGGPCEREEVRQVACPTGRAVPERDWT
jgi:hypothetical protein